METADEDEGVAGACMCNRTDVVSAGLAKLSLLALCQFRRCKYIQSLPTKLLVLPTIVDNNTIVGNMTAV